MSWWILRRNQRDSVLVRISWFYISIGFY